MNYTLAKKLKDAGFPQKGMGHRMHGPKFEDEMVTFPFLEELIKTCKEKLHSFTLNITTDATPCAYGEQGNGDIEDRKKFYETGSTPLEAVAMLWLTLNKN